MKILFDHSLPFLLAHGGVQTQVERTMGALREEGFECDYLRWWDDRQEVGIIHYVGRPGGDYVECARRKGIPLVVAELHGRLGSRPPWLRAVQKGIKRGAERLLPGGMLGRLGWNAYRQADAFVALTPWEAELMVTLFGADPAKVHVVPNGVAAVFLERPPVPPPRNEWLVCTATITERKRIVEMARAAVEAQTPLWVVGRPYAEDDPYYRAFLELVRAHPRFLRYEGPVGSPGQMAEVLRSARGFVLLSAEESHSLSAEEAAACGCPLLLSDLPWARSVFGAHAQYAPIERSVRREAAALRDFYQGCPAFPPPRPPMGWREVARRLGEIYRSLR